MRNVARNVEVLIEVLAIDWNDRELRIVAGRTAGRGSAGPRIRLEAAVAHSWPESLKLDDADALGAELRRVIDSHRLGDSEAVVCIPRRSVILKLIDVPEATADELASIVRLQALRDLTIPVEDAVIDYLPCNDAEEQGKALLAILVRPTLELVTKAVAAAGLTLRHVWPVSLARVEWARGELSGVADASKPSGLQAVIVADDRELEISLLESDRFIASASRPRTADRVQTGEGEGSTSNVEVDSMLGPLRKALSSLQMQIHGAMPRTAIFAGEMPDASKLRDIFTKADPASIIARDPLAAMSGRTVEVEAVRSGSGKFAGPVGALLLTTRKPADRIDFLNPKKPAVRADRRRPLALVGAAAALAVGLQTHSYYSAQKRMRLDRTAKHRTEQKQLATELQKLTPRRIQAEFLDAWRNADLDELNVLDRLYRAVTETASAGAVGNASASIGAADARKNNERRAVADERLRAESTEHLAHSAKGRIVLSAISVGPAASAAAHSASVSIEGLAESQAAFADFVRRLDRDSQFEVRPGPVQPSGSTGGQPVWRFTAELLARRPAAEESP